MSRKSILAVAAIAALGTSTLVASDASAFGRGFGAGHVPAAFRLHRPFGSFKVVQRGYPIHCYIVGISCSGAPKGSHPPSWAKGHFPSLWFQGGGLGNMAAGQPSPASAQAAATPQPASQQPTAPTRQAAQQPVAPSRPTTAQQPAAPCSYLTKQYLSDGSVLFADLCTGEQAMATPAQAQNQVRAQVPMPAQTQPQ